MNKPDIYVCGAYDPRSETLGGLLLIMTRERECLGNFEIGKIVTVNTKRYWLVNRAECKPDLVHYEMAIIRE